ncbi:MAG: M3 family metallopeptidase [Microbacteriaceae bacterium]|nr:M3 family metallopeptidase [Microbacteriaceae bacterium]
MADQNPFFSRSTLPHGLPPFGLIRDEHFREAFDRGIAEQLAEIASIIADPDAATPENTLLPLQRSGQVLARVSTVFSNRCSADSSEFTRTLEAEMAPILAAHGDAIRLDPKLFQRISAIVEQLPQLDLDAETRYLVERYRSGFLRSGAALNDTQKNSLRTLNQTLSSLTTEFEQRLLADTNASAVVVDDPAELDGLTAGQIAAAAQAAADRGLVGKYLLALVLPTGQPVLAQLTNRTLRERLSAASRARSSHGGENDTTALVVEISQLRAERASLLGFQSHAAYITADETAGSPNAVAELLGRLAPIAARNARTEQFVLQAELDAALSSAGHAPDKLTAADWAFYTERARVAKYAVDFAELRPYFEAENVLQNGVFFAATKLYGVTFTERPDLVGYHPEARVFEVANDDGSPVGLYLLDLYTRDSKRGGAWMNALSSQSYLLEKSVVVVNNLNVLKPPVGEPTLLSFDEVVTLFHEFGHALHGLFARVIYPKFAGTSVRRDFVEYPSQVNEMWMLWPEVLSNYAVHYQTAERIPEMVLDRVRAASAFNEGFATSEYLAAAILDQAWHTIPAGTLVSDVAAFERQALAAAGLNNPAVPPRYSSAYFAHIFSGGYSAGYYSYIWSEVLDADTGDWFVENGGLTRANGDRFRAKLLGVGGSKDPLEAFRDFRGRDAAIEPLLVRRGLSD